MKKVLHLFVLLVVAVSASAQERHRPHFTGNFFEICEQADEFYRNDFARATYTVDPRHDDEYRAYQRWKWYWKTRVDENGNFPDAVTTQAEARTQQTPSITSTTWTNISQSTCTGGYNGMGRATCVAFHPTQSNTFFVGAPIGGLWKTTDGGNTYTPLTDSLPYVSVGSCLIEPANPSVMYISVGDHVGWWNFSLGVYKTTDGGNTWAATGLSWTLAQNRAIAKLAMDPNNSSVIYAATTNGLYKTTNAGTSWTVVHSGDHSDIEFEPGTSNIYTARYDYWGSSEVYRSTDGGSSWTTLTSFNINYNYIRLAVTPANPAKLAIVCSENNHPLYVSTNYGSNLTQVGNCPEDNAFMISPNNENIFYCGYLFVHRSDNGGSSWTQKTYWYFNPPYDEVHADQRNCFYHPLQPDQMFFCNDGGIYRYSESGDSWTELTDGLRITQFYKVCNSPTNSQIILGGTQDNGGRMRMNNGTWKSTNGGDAMEIAIDPTNNNVIYTTYIYGQLYRSLDAWTNDTYHDISANIPGGTPPGSWVTPYVLDPSDHNTIVAGYDDVWRSTDRGDNWTQISTSIAGGNTLNCIAVAPSNPNTIYAAEGNTLYSTTNLGGNWTSVTVPGSAEITAVVVHPQYPQVLWVTRGGYTGSQKVYHSTTGGTTWTNISTGLPNVPVNAMIYVNGSSNSAFYVGTDAGVYYRDSTNNIWYRYSTGLPNTSVTDFDIFYPTAKLRASTFGRGIWEVDLATPLGTNPPQAADNATLTVSPNPAENELRLYFDSKSNDEVLIEMRNITGQLVWSKTITAAQAKLYTADVSGQAAGTYLIRLVQGNTVLNRKLVVK